MRYCQIAGQIRNKANKFIEKPYSFAIKNTSEALNCKWQPKTEFLPACANNNSEAAILKGYFNFLNKEKYLNFPAGWNQDSLAKLWTYNLHYFDYIWLLDYPQAKILVLDWIEKHPLLKNNTGWESYPISLRIMNWCSVFFHKYRLQTESDIVFLKKLCDSIYLQTEWLIKHLEVHLMGNHLLENAAALVFAGSCFEGNAAANWYKKGKDILYKQVPEQILFDGMHFELSVMYHLRITSLLANLFNINNPEINNIIEAPLKRMLEALGHITHPDGNISLFNDSAFNIYNSPDKIISYTENLFKSKYTSNNKGAFALPEAGYYGYRDFAGNYIICDAASIGPDYIPGHAHADIFSFELSLKGHRVIVDSGVYDYEISQIRQYCRSTKAHNTIEIDNHNQSEMWAAFRVARRGKPFNVQWKPSDNGFELSGTHDGYKRLKGNPLHHRIFTWDTKGKLIVKDIITSKCNHIIKSRVHLNPNCKIIKIENNIATIQYPKGIFTITFIGKGNLDIEDSIYCPEFGKKLPNKALVFTVKGSNIENQFILEAR